MIFKIGIYLLKLYLKMQSNFEKKSWEKKDLLYILLKAMKGIKTIKMK